MKRWLTAGFTLFLLLFLLPAGADAASALAADGAHILALDADGNVWAWGSNQRGESDPTSREMRVTVPVKVMENARAIACGRQFSMALTFDGELFLWGDNSLAQIPGLESEIAEVPVKVAQEIREIAACESRAACVTEQGEVYLWGNGQEKTLLWENAVDVALGADFALILCADGDVYSVADAEPVRVLEDCAAVYAAGQSAYAVKRDGTLLAWGANGTEGRLGVHAGMWVDAPTAIPLSGVVRVVPGLTAGAALTQNHELYIWGTVYSFVTHFDEDGFAVGSLVDAELVHYGADPICLFDDALDAAFGDAFVAVLLSDGSICTWGSNDQGQIGSGTFTETAYTPAEDEDDEGEITIISSEQCVFPYYLRLDA